MKNPAHRESAGEVLHAANVGLFASGFDFPEHFDADRRDATTGEAETLGDADGDVDNPAFHIRSTVGDGDDFGFTIRLIDHAHLSAHGKSLVSCSGCVVFETLAAGRAGSEVGADGIPGGFAMLDGFHREFGFVGLRFGSCIPS